jgi:DeoD family purine-nucleoside phosphorylase
VAAERPIHLRPTAELAERVLLPGDPGRALALAQLLLERPRMFNHHRGLWGYTGTAQDGCPLTIQSTGMGGPSAAIVLHELIELGVRRAIRVGTCGALEDDLALGDLVVASEAICADGTSRALGAEEVVVADPAIVHALGEQLAGRSRRHRVGRVVSTDVFYDSDSERSRDWSAGGALAVEMEAATLMTLGASLGVPVGCVLAVSDLLDRSGGRVRIADRDLMQAAETMGAVAAAALEPSSTTSR